MSSNPGFESLDASLQDKNGKLVMKGIKGISFNFHGIGTIAKSDHTPTPTRFIRNCEEVGLFQDLQNVNPFDEGFRNALNSSTSDDKLNASVSTDDTLHTPNIIPAISNVCSIPSNRLESEKVVELDGTSTNANDPFRITIVKNADACDDVHMEKDQSEVLMEKSDDDANNRQQTGTNATSKLETVEKHLDKRRESNRLAARRSYHRRAQIARENQNDVEDLRDENARLRRENESLAKEVKTLRRQLRTLTSSIILGEHKDYKCQRSLNASSINDTSVNMNPVTDAVIQQSSTPVLTSKFRKILPKLTVTDLSQTSNIICIPNSCLSDTVKAKN